MKIRSNLKLKKIGKQYMLVDSASGAENETNIYTMNATAAFLWEKIGEQDIDAEKLVGWMCEKYDVERATVANDVVALLKEWQSLGLITE